MSLSFIRVVKGVRMSFLLEAEPGSVVWVDRTLFTHLPVVSGHLGCLPLLATVSDAAVNMVCKCLFESLLCIPPF